MALEPADEYERDHSAAAVEWICPCQGVPDGRRHTTQVILFFPVFPV